MDQKTEVMVLDYTDRWATLMLWWKAYLLAPVWAFPLLPFIGSIVSLTGSKPVEFTFVLLIVAGLAYFIDDVLKRKIRVEDDLLTHGFRSRNLSKLLSIGTDYKSSEVLPKKMLLTFSDQKSLQFKLSRLNAADYQRLLRYVENRYSHCKIDPVLTTLINCKKSARKVLVDDSKRFIIEYRTDQLWRKLWTAFLDTAAPWLRIGPVFILILCSPTWLGMISNGLISMQAWPARREAELNIYQMSTKMGEFSRDFFNAFRDVGNGVMDIAGAPIIATLSLSCLVYLMAIGIRKALNPNSIVVDREGLELLCSTPAMKVSIAKVGWPDVRNVSIKTLEDGAKFIELRLLDTNAKPFKLDFDCILETDRPRLVRALERFAPESTIDADLSEAMMPKQERSYTELWLQSLSTPPERSSLQALPAGRTLQNGRYSVVRRLAVGGQGIAYLCHDTLSDKQVVLKETMIPIYAERSIKEQALKRFEQEAKILETIDCDQIVKLEDYFFEEHRGYLVLEHVDGTNLRDLVRESGALSETKVRELAQQMCTILTYLHHQKIIHRDFTPDNLLLNKQGQLKLIDFNVAQLERVGTTGTIAGKHAYLPPEQFRGKATTQSDIYALGSTLFFLLTGTDPEPITQSMVDSETTVSDSLSSIIRDCTALDVTKRCASVETVIERLRIESKNCQNEGANDHVNDHGTDQQINSSGDERHDQTTSLASDIASESSPETIRLSPTEHAKEKVGARSLRDDNQTMTE